MGMNPRLLRPSGGFVPSRLPGLEFWFDTLTPSTYTQSSGQITEWRSRVGSFSVAQTTPNNRPTLFESTGNVQTATRAEINGRQAFYFDGTNDFLISTATITGSQYTALAVCRPQNTTGTRGVLTRDFGSLPISTRGPQYLRQTDGVSQSVALSDVGGIDVNGPSVTVNTPILLSCVKTASDLTVFVNNVGGSVTAAVQNNSSDVIRIGNAFLTLFFWLGEIGEILLYNRPLSPAEHTAVWNYARARWGL
jgi:hypothetical protein